jgi:hypothetical protein
VRYISWLLDVSFIPVTLLSGVWFRLIKFVGLKYFRLTQKIFRALGFFPIVKHYYEPQFDFSTYQQQHRSFPAIDFKVKQQLELLDSLNYAKELLAIPRTSVHQDKYYYDNGSFSLGDAECYYSLIRQLKPSRIIEIGSGFSTLIACEAIKQNKIEDNHYTCKLTCIEPYEMPWLEGIGVDLIRKKVEDTDIAFFNDLNNGDFLFIDSSHVIRPEGDVLFEIFKILPNLKKGVWVHFHDIFTPLNYPEKWLKEEFRFWNEQYLLEAFLSYNDHFEIVLSMACLTLNHQRAVHKAFPILSQEPSQIPGSMWIKKVK